MGMYDEVWWEAELPAGHPPTTRLFQTQTLDRCFDHYIVTQEGRLCLVGNGWQDDGPYDGTQRSYETVDLDFHGDIRLVSSEDGDEEYIARFTHGTLEWIRPRVDVPQIRRSLIAPGQSG